MLGAPLLGAATALAGLWLGVHLSLSVGGVIATAAGVVYLLSAGARWCVRRSARH